MKTIPIYLLFALLPAATAFPQTPHLDSLADLLPGLPQDTSKAAVLLQLTNQLNSYDLAKALTFGREGVALAGKLDDPASLPQMETALGRTFANLSQPDSALFYFKKAKAGFEKNEDRKGVAGVLSKMRWVQNYLGNYEQAAELALETLLIYQELKDEPGEAIACTYLAEALKSLKKYDEAIQYCQKAYQIQKKLNLKDDLAYTAQLLGDTYVLTGNYDESLRYANESLEIRRGLGNDLNIALSLNCRGNVLKHVERFDEALSDYRESGLIAEKVGFSGLQMATLSNSADVYNRMKDYRRALPAHLKMAKMIEQTGEKYKAVENLRLIASAYAGLGRFDSAYFYQKLHTELGDSLHSAESNARVSELQTQYETAQKEATIAIQQEQIERQRTVQWFSFGIGGLLLLVAGLLFRGYRAKQRNNRALQQKNDAIALLLKEIHHRVKNNLQIIASLLNLQTGHIKDETALDAVREGKARVESMGLIHQKLYSTDNVTTVDMRAYLYELGDTLLHTFGIQGERVRIVYHVNPLELDVDTAIPLGLIVNELVTNSLKYAFPQDNNGIIEILLEQENSADLLLEVSDDGMGTSGNHGGTSFGTSLVKMLSKKLNGVPQVESGPGKGTKTSIRFEKVLRGQGYAGG